MNRNAVSVLKPGLLVSLKTSLLGGVEYSRIELEREHLTDDGTRRARWETLKAVSDPAEHDAATKVRSEARSIIARVCCPSAFGLLCPSDKAELLEEAIESARYRIREFNQGASLSRVELYVLVGRIAADDAEATRAISSELRQLVDRMTAGIRAADPEAIRAAATEAKALGGMLTAGVRTKVEDAISEARRIARQVVKAGETAAQLVGDLKLEALDAARFAFLDLDGGSPVETEAPAGRGLDLAPVAAASRETSPSLNTIQLEF